MDVKTSNQIRDGFLILGTVITLGTAVTSFNFAAHNHPAKIDDVLHPSSFVFKEYNFDEPKFQSPMFRNMHRWGDKY